MLKIVLLAFNQKVNFMWENFLDYLLKEKEKLFQSFQFILHHVWKFTNILMVYSKPFRISRKGWVAQTLFIFLKKYFLQHRLILIFFKYIIQIFVPDDILFLKLLLKFLFTIVDSLQYLKFIQILEKCFYFFQFFK